MEISYLGHSCFKLKGKQGIVVTDPFSSYVGFPLGSVSADVVTVSHAHADHNNVTPLTGTAKRDKPWVVNTPGEYEIAGISVFGYPSFHDGNSGKERGTNTIYQIVLDGVNIVHLGDLGHALDDDMIENFGSVDVLMCPVGGAFTLDPDSATEVIQSIEPSYVIPMHYKTDKHGKMFGELKTVEEFEKVFGITVEPVKSLTVNQTGLPEQTTLVVLSS